MKTKILTLMMTGLMAVPLFAMADNFAGQTCGNDSYQSLLEKCLAKSPDACSQIIQNNCLSLNQESAAITLSQITDAMIAGYAGKITADTVQPQQTVVAPVQQVAAPRHNSLLGAPIFHNAAQEQLHKEINKRRPASKTKSSDKQPNYWF